MTARSTGAQALSALRVKVGAALDARTPPIPFLPANYKPADGRDDDRWWVEESPAGATSMQAECGPPDPANVRDSKDVVQYLLRAPRDVGYFALRDVADAITASIEDVALTLDDGVTPVIVTSSMVGGLRDVDEFGRVSMPVVVFYEYLAPRVVT